MKYFIYLILLLGFGVAQAQDEAAQKALDFIEAQAEALIAQNKVFNPVEQKATDCQQYEEVKKTLSCEGEDCPPLYDSTVPFVLRFVASQVCSFECTVGERMCDETLHPGDTDVDFLSSSKPRCSRSDDDVVNPVRDISYDEDGVKYIVETIIYSDGCEEWTKYVEICNTDGTCREIEKYSEEWYEHEKQQQLKEYEESCFVATEADCNTVKQEMNQCVLDVTNKSLEFLCDSSKNPLWRYRKYGGEGLFFVAKPVEFRSFKRKRYSEDYDTERYEELPVSIPTVEGENNPTSE